jgi:hypothetical protein
MAFGELASGHGDRYHGHFHRQRAISRDQMKGEASFALWGAL